MADKEKNNTKEKETLMTAMHCVSVLQLSNRTRFFAQKKYGDEKRTLKQWIAQFKKDKVYND